MDDRLYINGATGKVELDPNTRLPDEISLTTGETCMIEGKREFHKFQLVKIADGEAVIRHTGHARNREIDETVRVAPYEDASWKADPKDPTRVTYTEWDEGRRVRVEKHYRGSRLDGAWTQWYDNGQKEFEYHFVNGDRNGRSTEWYPTGEKRYEVRYTKGQKVGKEYWWGRDGTVSGLGDHPAPDKAGKPSTTGAVPADGSFTRCQVRVEVRGTLAVTAIGATVTATRQVYAVSDPNKELPHLSAKQTWKLDLASGKDLGQTAKDLNGKTVLVTGWAELRELVQRTQPGAASIHTFSSKAGATWRIYPPNSARDKRVPLATLPSDRYRVIIWIRVFILRVFTPIVVWSCSI